VASWVPWGALRGLGRCLLAAQQQWAALAPLAASSTLQAHGTTVGQGLEPWVFVRCCSRPCNNYSARVGASRGGSGEGYMSAGVGWVRYTVAAGELGSTAVASREA
jgi:hypothetical protein